MDKKTIKSIENALRSNDYISNFKASDDICPSLFGEEFCQKWDFHFLLPRVIFASLCVKPDFPHSRPIIFIEKKHFRKWPHVEINGKLCLSEPPEMDPKRIIAYTIKDAYDLLRDSIKGENIADFRDEMQSYWKQCAPHKAKIRIISIVSPPFKTKIVSAYQNEDFILLADNTEQAKQWLSNYYGPTSKKGCTFFNSIFVNIGNKIICPLDYPKNGVEFLKLLDPFYTRINNEIWKAFADSKSLIVTCINVETERGDCLVASIQNRPNKDKISKGGFRGVDKLSIPLFKNRLFSSKPQNSNVERADVSWIYGRDKNRKKVNILSKKNVTIIGCGSVGSSVAELLLKSGVGKMHLIDGDKLSTANVSRHVLGMNSYCGFKSIELCSKFRKSYPHAKIEADPDYWHEIKEFEEIFESSDLILELTADKYSFLKLNAWHTKTNKRNTPIIYGYTENHAVAGFCITIGKSGGDIECALDKQGQYQLQITKWPDGHIHQEAGCGAEFASYGAIELQYTTSLIARKAIEILLQQCPLISEIKCWVADKETVEAAGGEWDEEWKGCRSFFRDEGFLIFSKKL